MSAELLRSLFIGDDSAIIVACCGYHMYDFCGTLGGGVEGEGVPFLVAKLFAS